MMDEYTKIIIDVLEHRGKKPQEKSLVNINDGFHPNQTEGDDRGV